MISKERRSLLSSQSRIQVPWVKVVIGDYTFGVFSKNKNKNLTDQGYYSAFDIQYPNFIQSLSITKINGQVNQYSLQISYPVTQFDDPNFFEKVFSSVSNTRKIVFSYGDASLPTYSYKDEEAIITSISQSFSIQTSVITYTIEATSTASLTLSGSFTFNKTTAKPSDLIKKLFRNSNYNLPNIFKGMNESNLDYLIAGGDKTVTIEGKRNISVLDYLTYLVSCMIPADANQNNTSKDIYILTIHDDTIYDSSYEDSLNTVGPYFKVSRITYATEQADAYEIDIGYNTSTIVSQFGITNNENYSLYYNYQSKLDTGTYTRRINNKGEWEDVYAPTITSNNDEHLTKADDITWWTKVTKYPIGATITVQGLLRPATLMQYVRLNVIFPGGHKHNSSGLYIVTAQQDTIDSNGYKTQLKLTRVSGDLSGPSTITNIQ